MSNDIDLNDWYGSSRQTEEVPMFDEGKGDKFVLRDFVFKRNPLHKGKELNKQELFDAHWQQIKTVLWGDGFVPIKEIQPRVVVEDEQYQIFISCKPRLGAGVVTQINEESTTLQEIFKPKG